MNIKNESFVIVYNKDPHFERGREILKKYPEVKKLIRPYPLTALYLLVIVVMQFVIGYFLKEVHWGWNLLVAYLVGSVASHALFVLMHDASHNLVVKSDVISKMLLIISNVGQGIPSGIAFQKYHLMHHAFLNKHEIDPDPPTEGEARWVGNSFFKKMIWLFLLGLVQAARPTMKKLEPILNGWFFANIFIVFGVDALFYYFVGFEGLMYVVASTIFALGIHPLGARWLQEHYLFEGEQETYSYYGIGNVFGFNIGYHNEHHDLMSIPWVHLPKVRKIAPEYYDTLIYHQSWMKLYFQFFLDRSFTLYKRFKRDVSL